MPACRWNSGKRSKAHAAVRGARLHLCVDDAGLWRATKHEKAREKRKKNHMLIGLNMERPSQAEGARGLRRCG
jgi:hypothetical protein